MVITLGFRIAPICEAAQIFLQIFKKTNDSTSNKIPVKQVEYKYNYFCLATEVDTYYTANQIPDLAQSSTLSIQYKKVTNYSINCNTIKYKS